MGRPQGETERDRDELWEEIEPLIQRSSNGTYIARLYAFCAKYPQHLDALRRVLQAAANYKNPDSEAELVDKFLAQFSEDNSAQALNLINEEWELELDSESEALLWARLHAFCANHRDKTDVLLAYVREVEPCDKETKVKCMNNFLAQFPNKHERVPQHVLAEIDNAINTFYNELDGTNEEHTKAYGKLLKLRYTQPQYAQAIPAMLNDYSFDVDARVAVINSFTSLK